MLASYSEKFHPVFDLLMARQVFDASTADRELRGEIITSPFDLYCVETLRDRFKLRIKDAFETDIFVFGKGAGRNCSCTRIGGMPTWPEGRPWPRDSQGGDLQFLAQVNFADSTDLFADLPGAILAVFVDKDGRWLIDPACIHLEWFPSGLSSSIACDTSLMAVKGGPFYGAICRSADYPYAARKAWKSQVARGYLLPILSGTKIGGLPHFILRGEEMDDEFLCQIGSVQPEPVLPYPWFDEAEPLELDATERGIYGSANCYVIGDMGSIYIFRRDDGACYARFESL